MKIFILLLSYSCFSYAGNIEFVLNGTTYLIDDYKVENNGKRIRINAPNIPRAKISSNARCTPYRYASSRSAKRGSRYQKKSSGDIFNMVSKRLAKIKAKSVRPTYRKPSSTRKTYTPPPIRRPSIVERFLNDLEPAKKKTKNNYQ